MILLIDNYDSFSYNLYQLIGTLDPDIKVVRNDELTIDEIRQLGPKAIILSPGPGRPADAGICEDVVKELSGEFPMLGVCLGHQAICEAHGGTVTYAKELMHGKQSLTALEDDPLFEGIASAQEAPDNPDGRVSIQVARYHSLAAEEGSLPEDLRIIARTDDGEVMAVRDREHPVYGLQFHPESIMTPSGMMILKNFLSIAEKEN